MRQRIVTWLLPLGLAAFVFLTGCDTKPEAVKLEGLQGTATWHVTLTTLPKHHTVDEIQQGLDKALAHTNAILGTWDEKAEISKFNQSTSTEWIPVSKELAHAVSTSLRLSAESNGLYDVTVGPLLKVWGFQKGEPGKGVVPPQADIDAAKAKVGYQKLQVRFEPQPALRKAQADIYVELASLADGYAVDQAGEYLESIGIQDYMVEVAGEVRTRGKSPRGDDWRIAIEKPVEVGHVVQQGLKLNSVGLATSGDYRNFFMVEGKRYSHTIDPITGIPVQHRLASVSVLAKTGLEADGYATLLMVLGEEKGKVFAEQHKLAAYFIWRTDKGFEHYTTPQFQPALINLQ